MPKRSRTPKKDENDLAKSIVDRATRSDDKAKKNPAAVALGRLGGKKGGPARAIKLSATRRSQIAREAARARWDSKTKEP